MTIQLHRLEGFYRVARAGSYARAARSFPYPITAPGVHAQVRMLEQELGTKLFETLGRSLRTTPAGEALLAFCAPFFDAIPDVVRAVAGASFGGTLRIDAAPLFTEQLLPDWLARLRRARPDIDVAIVDAHGPSLERLRRGECDLLVEYVEEVPEGFTAKTIAHSRAFVAVPSRHPFVRRRDTRALRGECLVAYSPELPHHALQMDAVRTRIGTPPRVITAPSVAALLAFVRAGLGFSIVPWPDARGPRVPGLAAIPVKGAQFPVRAIARRTAHPQPLVDAALALSPDPDGPSDAGRARRKSGRRRGVDSAER
jgi:DNA-binding transcriptional LysR family regulator